MFFFKRKFFLFLFSFIFLFTNAICSVSNLEKTSELKMFTNLYEEINLKDLISVESFINAMNGTLNYKADKKNIITIIDFTKPSTDKRMVIIDIEEKKILLESYVSHAKKTGDLYAEKFSNKNGSLQSSCGFFLTGSPYDGKNGYSLEIFGLEKGKNDLVKLRNIVIHGADYANPEFIIKNGRLGRSKGCFAVPVNLNEEIINLIKDGSLMYVHSKDENSFFHNQSKEKNKNNI